ncbi:hypothetical protein [Fulvivirga sedimenti]|jgi:hypothetical protein|uniref:Uncharacterized protein n=1 Tax=Fulvivirga sedimenti TaxID=2879465 RepID=A0A9X1HN17_9BACT|nr:hypothetical protein [Fulvivirga sedimenti]MCA6073823.1 hypothetical protein [Fulvivirga sedimenti]
MRVIGDIPHELYKISLFDWNGKFIIKIESGPYEQSFKIDQMDISETDIPQLMDTTFMKGVTRRFHEMHMEMASAMERL